MPTLSDFEFVTTGGNLKPAKPFKARFKSESRTGSLAYLLLDLYAYSTRQGSAASIELRINKKVIGSITPGGGQSVHIIRFGAHLLLPIGSNTFEATGKNASATFGTVVCHFHQNAASSFLPG